VRHFFKTVVTLHPNLNKPKMKKLLLITGLALALASCGGKSSEKEMTPEEETQFATEEVKAIDSSVTTVVDSIDTKEAKVNDLLKGI